VAADAFEQFALAALFALLPGWYAGFVGKGNLVPGLVEVNDEFFQNSLTASRQGSLPSRFRRVPLRAARKRDVEDVFETLHHSTLTRSPSMVGEKRPWFLVTYSRSTSG